MSTLSRLEYCLESWPLSHKSYRLLPAVRRFLLDFLYLSLWLLYRRYSIVDSNDFRFNFLHSCTYFVYLRFEIPTHTLDAINHRARFRITLSGGRRRVLAASLFMTISFCSFLSTPRANNKNGSILCILHTRLILFRLKKSLEHLVYTPF